MNIFDSLEEHSRKYKREKERKQQQEVDCSSDYTYERDYTTEQQEDPELDLGCIMLLLTIVALICLYQFLEDLFFAIDEIIRAHAWSFSIFIVCAILMLVIHLNSKR